MGRTARASLEELSREVFEITKVTWLMTPRTRRASHYDLSETEFLTLDALEQQGCLTVGAVQRRIQVVPAQMSRILRNLETKHERPLVRCAINAKDKRRVDVRLTKAGTAAVAAFRRHKITMTQSALRSLRARDRERLRRVVHMIRQAIDKMVPR